MDKEKFVQILAMVAANLGKWGLIAAKVLVFAGGVLVMAMWKIISHMFKLSDEMASFFTFGHRRRYKDRNDTWW